MQRENKWQDRFDEKFKCIQSDCDERGYISDTEYPRHLCDCGWTIDQSMLKFKVKKSLATHILEEAKKEIQNISYSQKADGGVICPVCHSADLICRSHALSALEKIQP